MRLTKRLQFLIFNFLGLEITWGACAYGTINEWPLLGVYVGFIYLVLHMLLASERIRDLMVLFIVGLLGIALDVLNTQLGIIAFAGQQQTFLLIPYWLMMLWLVFALMLPHSLFWLEKNIYIAAIVGAIGGAGSYLLGHSLGALVFPESTTLSFIIIFLEWAIFFPLALKIVKYINSTQLVKQGV